MVSQYIELCGPLIIPTHFHTISISFYAILILYLYQNSALVERWENILKSIGFMQQ